MKQLFKLFVIIFLVFPFFLLASDSVELKQELVTAWVITSVCFENSRTTIDELRRDYVIRTVYRGTQDSAYVTLEFAENWVKNFKRMRTVELQLKKKQLERLRTISIDPKIIRSHSATIRQREKEETLTFHEWLTLYNNNFEKLQTDIRKTESRLHGIVY